MYHIGVISDTHGLLREEVIAVLQGCDVILHGGDVDRESVLEALRNVAPLYVVRGNVDREWAKDLPVYLETELFGIHVKLVHNKKDLPAEAGNADLVVFGHSHKYLDETREGTRFLNPGSCGPKRFLLPVTMAVVDVDEKGIHDIRRIDITQKQAGNAATMPGKIEDMTMVSGKEGNAATVLGKAGNAVTVPGQAGNAATVLGKAGNATIVSEKAGNAVAMPEQAGNTVIMPEAEQDRRKLVKAVIRDVDRGRTVAQIARNHHIHIELAEQICRMYLTHPGVDVDGILNRIS